jgi:hypothetical protein
MKKITHVAKAAPCTHRMSGRGGLAWNRLASTVWLNPQTTSPAIASDMQK